MVNNTKIIYDYGTGFELGYFVSDTNSGVIVNLITGLNRGETSIGSSNVFEWSKDLELKLCLKYEYNSEFFDGVFG